MEPKNYHRRKETIYELVDRLIIFEKERGIRFTGTGLPIPEDWMFLRTEPRDILPYDHRLEAGDPKTTVLCFYQKDECLYRRLTVEKLRQTAEELNKFQGFCGFDLSILTGMLTPFQDFYVLANLVIDTYFCLHGAKLIPNMRSDERGGKTYFPLLGKAPIVACGTLGCSRNKIVKRENITEIEEYAKSHPHQLIIQYGSNLCSRPNTQFFKGYGRWRKHA